MKISMSDLRQVVNEEMQKIVTERQKIDEKTNQFGADLDEYSVEGKDKTPGIFQFEEELAEECPMDEAEADDLDELAFQLEASAWNADDPDAEKDGHYNDLSPGHGDHDNMELEESRDRKKKRAKK